MAKIRIRQDHPNARLGATEVSFDCYVTLRHATLKEHFAAKCNFVRHFPVELSEFEDRLEMANVYIRALVEQQIIGMQKVLRQISRRHSILIGRRTTISSCLIPMVRENICGVTEITSLLTNFSVRCGIWVHHLVRRSRAFSRICGCPSSSEPRK
jgi:hypothetical protein